MISNTLKLYRSNASNFNFSYCCSVSIVLHNMARSTGHVANHERHTTAIQEKMKSQAHEKYDIGRSTET